MALITARTQDGRSVRFESQKFSSGGMKDAHWGEDKSYVVLFFREAPAAEALERLRMITEVYYERIFEREGGSYWNGVLSWPRHILEHEGKVGIVTPVYPGHFFFEYGSVNNDMLGIKGNEKEGRWFASASNQNRFLDDREKGDWRSYFRICILISRAVKRLHSAGLAHSDLSYKNVLVDPAGGNACIIDIDSLVVPGKFPPDVVGTPDFIAPEVMATKNLVVGNPDKQLPSINTDKHALAVLVYMYLLYRHPLRGGKVHDTDPVRDEELSMGSEALFVEHPTNLSNRPNLENLRPSVLPWGDPQQVPYTVCGPYLKALFDRAFIQHLHEPHLRPSANEWEIALVKTLDLMQPCMNKNCKQKWFVFDNSTQPKCPFCSTPYTRRLPVLNLYSARVPGEYKPDNHRIMVYDKQYFYPWHMNRNIFPNERIKPEDAKPVAYFAFHGGKWLMINQNMPDLEDITDNKPIPIGQPVELSDGRQILFSKASGGRMAVVQMVN